MSKHKPHTKDEIFKALQKADVAAVATHEASRIKQRQMHFAVSPNLELFFATMKGDPKTLQITSDAGASILILNRSGDMPQWSETECSGTMHILHDEKDKKRAAKIMYDRSPIVKNLMDAKQEHILDWLVFRPSTIKYRIFGEIVQGYPPTILNFKEEIVSFKHDMLALRKLVNIWYKASRAQFLLASVLPIAIGSAVAYWETSELKTGFAILTLVAGLLFHLGANLLNDYFDHLGGSDTANTDFVRPFTGGSRVIQLGLLQPHSILLAGGLFLLGGVGIGVYLAWLSGPILWVLGGVGIVAALLYSLPKYGFASLGMGEIVIGLVFGPLMSLGAYYVQLNLFDWLPVVVSLPVSLLIFLILFANEFPDATADKKVGKRTLVVRLGMQHAAWLYGFLGVGSFVLLSYLSLEKIIPAFGWLGLLGAPLIVWGWENLQRNLHAPKKLAATCAATVSAHLISGAAIILAFADSKTHYDEISPLYSLMIVGLCMYLMWYVYRKKMAFDQAEKTFQK